MTQTPEQRRLIRLANSMNTKARRLGAPGEVTASELAQIYLRSPECYICHVGLEVGHFSFDHVLAFGEGGTNWPENIRPACFTCNREKFTKSPEEIASYRQLTVRCIVCRKEFHPRFAEWKAGRATTCSRSCAASKRWGHVASAGLKPRN